MNYKKFANRTVRSIPAGVVTSMGVATLFPDASGYTVAAAGVGGAIIYGAAEWLTEDPARDFVDAASLERTAELLQKAREEEAKKAAQAVLSTEGADLPETTEARTKARKAATS